MLTHEIAGLIGLPWSQIGRLIEGTATADDPMIMQPSWAADQESQATIDAVSEIVRDVCADELGRVAYRPIYVS